jgi:hypothetical protein
MVVNGMVELCLGGALGGLVARRLSVECWWEEGGNLGNRSPAQGERDVLLELVTPESS